VLEVRANFILLEHEESEALKVRPIAASKNIFFMISKIKAFDLLRLFAIHVPNQIMHKQRNLQLK